MILITIDKILKINDLNNLNMLKEINLKSKILIPNLSKPMFDMIFEYCINHNNDKYIYLLKKNNIENIYLDKWNAFISNNYTKYNKILLNIKLLKKYLIDYDKLKYDIILYNKIVNFDKCNIDIKDYNIIGKYYNKIKFKKEFFKILDLWNLQYLKILINIYISNKYKHILNKITNLNDLNKLPYDINHIININREHQIKQKDISIKIKNMKKILKSIDI